MSTTEEWRDSLTLPDYQVSSFGRVVRKVFYGPMPRGGMRKYGGQIHSGCETGEGRLILCYKGKTYKIHRLICEAFNGPAPKGAVCMHLDSNYKNNRPENLAWGTQKENLNHPVFIEYCKGRTGIKSPTIKHKMKNNTLQSV